MIATSVMCKREYVGQQAHLVAHMFSIYDQQWYEVDSLTLGQYTGRKDKHGRGIFEDDIILVNNRYAKIVKYSEKECAFMIANIHDLQNSQWMDIWQKPSSLWWDEFADSIEVIGNIHDNPEMLEEGFDFDSCKNKEDDTSTTE